jgi:hypothetical protein
MPDLFGLGLAEAEDVLEAAGVVVPSAIGYFGTWPISVNWTEPLPANELFFADSNLIDADSPIPVDELVGPPQAPGIVIDQVPGEGDTVAVNAPILLTVNRFPMGVAYGGVNTDIWGGMAKATASGKGVVPGLCDIGECDISTLIQ